jgi:guanylate kinase
MKGKLVILSAPSGAGKTTIAKQLLESDLGLEFSVSATTRPRRGKETDGKDYHFMDIKEFRSRIRKNDFVEWEEVYKDLYYGTLRSEIERIWNNGHHALFDIDVKGGINLKKKFGPDALSLFIMPPSLEELENRLKNRGTDTPDKIKMRLEKAGNEILLAREFDRIIINNQLEAAVAETINIVRSFVNLQ